MAALVHVHVDDFPDFLLRGFGDHKRATGHYPRLLRVGPILGEIMGARPGLWGPALGFPGVWGWRRELSKADRARKIDEFGRPE